MPKLTGEVLEQLKSVAPFYLSPVDYTPDLYNDLPEEARAVFSIMPFNRLQMNKITEVLSRPFPEDAPASMVTERINMMYDTVRESIKGWKRVYDQETGEEIKYDTGEDGHVKNEIWSYFPHVIVTDIFYKIMSLSSLNKAEKAGL